MQLMAQVAPATNDMAMEGFMHFLPGNFQWARLFLLPARANALFAVSQP